MLKDKSKTLPQFVDLTAGYIINVEIGARGGVSYDRKLESEVEVGRGLEATSKTTKLVDDRELVSLSQSVVSRAYYVLNRCCARTAIGYFATADMLEQVEQQFEEVREAVRDFNELARRSGSARRVVAEIYPLDVRPGSEVTAKRLAANVREKLQDLKDKLRTGDLKKFDDARDRARNLDRLAVGIQADCVKLALEWADGVKPAVREAARVGCTSVETACKNYDTGPVDAAIALFTPHELEDVWQQREAPSAAE